jgi:AcrR family transcriptional regulator
MPALTAPPAVGEPARLSEEERTRRTILDRAVVRATERGLESLSLGGLADELAMSKSGLFAHFGSKEELQLATIERAREIFVVEVIEPGLELPTGLERLRGLCEAWLSYAEDGVLPGGCFFATTTSEFANRPGVVRDRLESLMQQWLGLLERAIRAARRKHQLEPQVDAKRLAFEVFAVGDTASCYHGIFGNTAIATARMAIRQQIDNAAA